MKQFSLLMVSLLFLGSLSADSAAQQVFARKATIPVPAIESSGFGNIVAGVDFDADGKPDLFAVNSNWNDNGSELIPRIYKFEFNGTTWDSVWSATMNIPLQNTWPALTYGDLDNDGKLEIIWSPVNFLDATTNTNPDRVIVFEAKGDGSDVLGIASGGNYLPNASWTITDTAMFDLRPFRSQLADVDNDGKQEIVFCERGSGKSPLKAYRFGVIGVSAVPDNGDGSETWTLKYSGKDSTLNSSTVYDFAVMDSTIYLFHGTAGGQVTAVKYAAGTWSIRPAQAGVLPGGAWKSSCVVDLDADGTKEIVVPGWSSPGNTKVYLLRRSADTLTSAVIADFAALIGSSGQLYGGAAGDIDNDGKLDFVCGTRNATPNAAIVRLQYIGGAITSQASYETSLIDQKYATSGGRWDMIAMANVDADPQLEVFYGNGIGDPLLMPIVHLNWVQLAQTPVPIGAARQDLNGDLVADRTDTVTVVGIVNSVNYTASSNRFSYYIQDETGGINITKGSVTGGGTVYKVGDKLAVTGKVGQFNGSVQVEIQDSLSRWVTYLGSGFSLTPIDLTLDSYLAKPEDYEGRYIRVKGLAKSPGSAVSWPATNTDANYVVWDGFRTIVLRADRDTDLDGTVEPVAPFTATGVSTQYSTAVPPNDGYQIAINYYADIAQNVAVQPNRHFAMLEPANNATVVLNDTAQIVTFRWRSAVDLNRDTLTYGLAIIGKAVIPANRDTFATRTGKQLLPYLAGADSVVLRWTATAKDPANPAVFSLDTISVKIKRGTIVGVDEKDGLPVVFALEQNYPNPFNPTTTIRFALPITADVRLRVYDVLGREVTTLTDGVLDAGIHTALWTGSTRDGARVASGMYLCRIEARPVDGSPMFVEMKKMMLMK